jgi:hypothetical protein
MREPNVLVRDKETGHTYRVSEARYRRTPELWDRLGTDPAKPRTSVAAAAAKRKTASPVSKTPDSPEPDEKADSTATEKE